jgi:SAM-dependent methyltransferase
MDAYTRFAEVYDLFMDNVPYEEWCAFLRELLKKYGIEDGIILDLGCGTGKLTGLMAEAGFDMIGVDNSVDMLEIARETGKKDILYLMQDMREFELYGTVRAVYSACDSLNYILDEEDLLRVFKLVNNYLDPEGIFVFDLNTPYKYETQLGEQTFAENRPEGSFIWDNYYDSDSGINEYELTLFIPKNPRTEEFVRFQESHYQKSYPLSTIRRLLEEAGMEFLDCFDGYSGNPLTAVSERMVIVAREQGKTAGLPD